MWVAILQGLGISIIATITAVCFSYFQEKKYQTDLTPVLQQEVKHLLVNASDKYTQKRKVIEFVLLFISLFGVIFAVHAFFHVKLMLLIPVVILLWVITFYMYKRRYRKLLYIFRKYITEDVVTQTYQLNVMITVGILIFTLKQTSFSSIVVNSLHYVQSHLPFLNPLYFLPFIVILLGFLSLGPLTVMVLVAGILESMSLPYPPELIVLAITSGSVISILLSPVVMPVIVLSASNKLSLFTNGIKFNWKYAVVFLYDCTTLYSDSYPFLEQYIKKCVHISMDTFIFLKE